MSPCFAFLCTLVANFNTPLISEQVTNMLKNLLQQWLTDLWKCSIYALVSTSKSGKSSLAHQAATVCGDGLSAEVLITASNQDPCVKYSQSSCCPSRSRPRP